MVHPKDRLKAVERLQAEKKMNPDLARYFQFYQDLLQVQEESALEIGSNLEMVDGDMLSERMRAGLPQLSFEHLPIEGGSFRVLVQKILDLLLAYQGEPAVEIQIGQDDLLACAHDRFEQPQKADKTDLLVLAVDLASMPYLEHAAAQVQPHVDLAKVLEGSCPCCGGEPNFAYLEDEDGSRRLVCSRCRFVWRYKRIGCPFCGNTEPGKLRYYPAGEKKTYRLYVCDSCKRYLKALDIRIAGTSIDLIADPILTWSLDKSAREEGYF